MGPSDQDSRRALCVQGDNRALTAFVRGEIKQGQLDEAWNVFNAAAEAKKRAIGLSNAIADEISDVSNKLIDSEFKRPAHESEMALWWNLYEETREELLKDRDKVCLCVLALISCRRGPVTFRDALDFIYGPAPDGKETQPLALEIIEGWKTSAL